MLKDVGIFAGGDAFDFVGLTSNTAHTRKRGSAAFSMPRTAVEALLAANASADAIAAYLVLAQHTGPEGIYSKAGLSAISRRLGANAFQFPAVRDSLLFLASAGFISEVLVLLDRVSDPLSGRCDLMPDDADVLYELGSESPSSSGGSGELLALSTAIARAGGSSARSGDGIAGHYAVVHAAQQVALMGICRLRHAPQNVRAPVVAEAVRDRAERQKDAQRLYRRVCDANGIEHRLDEEAGQRGGGGRSVRRYRSREESEAHAFEVARQWAESGVSETAATSTTAIESTAIRIQ